MRTLLTVLTLAVPAAVLSAAANVEEIVEELRTTRMSERAGRLIDVDETSSMERKKREGYF